jgi:hypothetical protein
VGWVSGGAGRNFWGLIWFSPPLLTSANLRTVSIAEPAQRAPRFFLAIFA